ncbi:DoxX family protein [Chitinophaga japonensis]|uniref:Putative oxidoreductase n=1 Tax=Chitinophaga japonensis TaxID=104662 RepID=A0A562T3T9_CHIJA|nr:DoxX family protein [Chitinophaga japonensis]TWI88033.1 putative oxidoreductase [Chitinophaga japonensis]
MQFVVLVGRIFFSLIFLSALANHFSGEMAGYAASQGVPAPAFLVPLSGIIAGLGALSILFGYKAKLGAWLIIIFLVPVTFWMHAFWKMEDPMQQQTNMVSFMKNLSMLGAALMITYFGAGPISVDEKMARK